MLQGARVPLLLTRPAALRQACVDRDADRADREEAVIHVPLTSRQCELIRAGLQVLPDDTRRDRRRAAQLREVVARLHQPDCAATSERPATEQQINLKVPGVAALADDEETR